MNNTDAGFQHSQEAQEDLLHFSLSGLLEDNQTLVVHLAKHTAILFCPEVDGGRRMLTQQQFSPNGMRMLLPLLQAYPRYCPYEVLLATLFPLSLEEGRHLMEQDWEAAIRPVRRAMRTILAPLRAFHFKVSTVRGAGYLLTPLMLG
jgi:hypothetical protein